MQLFQHAINFELATFKHPFLIPLVLDCSVLIGSVQMSVHSSDVPLGIGGREGSCPVERSLF